MRQRIPTERVTIDEAHPVDDAEVYVEDHRLLVRLGRRVVTVVLGAKGAERLARFLTRRH